MEKAAMVQSPTALVEQQILEMVDRVETQLLVQVVQE
jgi:hypothetical protein